jgi:hypothetical protein
VSSYLKALAQAEVAIKDLAREGKLNRADWDQSYVKEKLKERNGTLAEYPNLVVDLSDDCWNRIEGVMKEYYTEDSELQESIRKQINEEDLKTQRAILEKELRDLLRANKLTIPMNEDKLENILKGQPSLQRDNWDVYWEKHKQHVLDYYNKWLKKDIPYYWHFKVRLSQ